MLRGLVGPFQRFLERSGAHEVLDLCAGAGGPARILAEEIARAGRAPPRFILTDLYPRVDYEEADLRAMVAPFGDRFVWEYGRYRYPPMGDGYYFFGVPARARP